MIDFLRPFKVLTNEGLREFGFNHSENWSTCAVPVASSENNGHSSLGILFSTNLWLPVLRPRNTASPTVTQGSLGSLWWCSDSVVVTIEENMM